MKPYYEDSHVTLFCGDCREVLPSLEEFDTLFTDPVWPNGKAELIGKDRPLAAKNANKKSVGIEIEERFCEIAVRRLKQEVLGL